MKIFISTISFFILLNAGYSQNPEQTFAHAQEQKLMENYENAISAYRRVLFFDSAKEFTYRAFYQVASCYEKTGNFEKSHYYYDLAFNSAKNDSLKNQIILDKSFLYILQQKPKFALMELASLKDSLPAHFQRQKTFYKGIIAFRDNKFHEAKNYFSSGLDSNKKVKSEKLDSLFLQLEDINNMNPKLAKYMSLAIPGLGQLYAGYTGEAVNSLLLSGGFWALYFYTASKYTLLDAILSIYPWFHRYYLGGFKKAGNLLEQKQQEQRNKILSEILELYKK